MTLSVHPERSSEPEVVEYLVRLLGTGATPTKELGQGITVGRTGAGAYNLTWAENPGSFQGMIAGLGAATPADLKGYTVVVDTPFGSNVLSFVVYDSTFNPVELAANQYLYLRCTFKRTAV